MNALKSHNNTSLDKNKRNQPSNNPFFEKAVRSETVNERNYHAQKLVTYITARTLILLLPIIEKDKQNVRSIGDQLGKSHETIAKMIREYSHEFIKGEEDKS